MSKNSEEKADSTIKRGEHGRFLKGYAPKSPGRPRKNEEAQEIFKSAAPEAAKKIVYLMNQCKSPKVQLECAKEIVRRVLGNPDNNINMEVSGNLDMRSQIRALLLERENARREGTD